MKRRANIALTRIGFVAFAAAMAFASGCDSDESKTQGDTNEESGNVHIEKFQIDGRISPSDESIPIDLDGGYCVGRGSRPVPGSRLRIDHVEVDETPESVTIRAFVTSNFEGPCRGIGDLIKSEVGLSGPIGDRQIIDGSREPPTPRAPKDNSESASVSSCGPHHYALPVLGTRLARNRGPIRFAYIGAKPCQFAATRDNGALYVELRSSIEPKPNANEPVVGCVQGNLQAPVSAGTRVHAVPGELIVDEFSASDVQDMLAPDAPCPAVAEGDPSFVID